MALEQIELGFQVLAIPIEELIQILDPYTPDGPFDERM
jgi:hypothetical protein